MRSAVFCILLSTTHDALALQISGRAPAPRMMAADTRTKIVPKGLPPKIADRVSFATSGVKQANQIQEIEILWKTFKGCYANEKLAIEAVTKNAVCHGSNPHDHQLG